ATDFAFHTISGLRLRSTTSAALMLVNSQSGYCMPANDKEPAAERTQAECTDGAMTVQAFSITIRLGYG
ncbi:MAG: hypothetical protein ACI9DC_005217, partial [Gammaproteobacteria bacterium]